MKPTVISNASASASSGTGNPQAGGNGVTIPINHEYRGQPATQQQHQPQYQAQAQHYVAGESQVTSYGSPGSLGRGQQPQQPHPQQQQIPAHFQQDFDFEPDMGIDMFPRSRLGRMTHDPFGDFGGTSRKRTSLHDPQFHTDGFSRYFDDAADFGFPQFNSLGRRRVNTHNDDDFFNRLPSEFRQYIPESFAHRRGGSGMAGSPGTGPTMAHPQQSTQQQPHFYNTMPQSPSRKVCDAAIQTEDPTGRSEVDHSLNSDLNQHGLRNTMDMGVKSPAENDNQSPRSSSAPPTEQQQPQQPQQQPYYSQPQQIPVNGPKRPTPPPQQQHQFATQTSPQIQPGAYSGQSPQFQKVYYAPQQQAHPQQKQQTPPPPQTPGGSYIRTIPIFVEGRSEPIINNKEIPNQNAPPNVATGPANSRAFTPPKQQPHRPTPLNTQQQPTSQQQQQSGGIPPQTPHTVDTINKIQDIQRDVLDLMSRVEKFSGTRADKEYVYLDEMLTRNLLKLDNIDTNGKESIRLARKEAIKCIQASINVLEAKAEENKKAAQVNVAESDEPEQQTPVQEGESPAPPAETQKSTSAEKVTKESTPTAAADQTVEPADHKNNEPIPLPPPESQKFNEVKIEDCPEDDAASTTSHQESESKAEGPKKENSSETK
ncbi:BAG domain-containing protein Samui isoform X1 [Lucilia cuprina]|uniref:BAG domain-containing protein Samui isoform X1 n=1 Tax=Lucilia cuprina TaxID=7375 RepID=UPI001F0703CE|nr:BAG domain-containing protein Samui isoform X1 [Lucilia cuprina]